MTHLWYDGKRTIIYTLNNCSCKRNSTKWVNLVIVLNIKKLKNE